MAESPRNKVATLPPFQPRSWEDLARGYADVVFEQRQWLQKYNDDVAETKAGALVASSIAAKNEAVVARLEVAVAKLNGIVAKLQEQIAPGGEIENRMDMRVREYSRPALEELRSTIMAQVHDQRGGVGNITTEQLLETLTKFEERKELTQLRTDRGRSVKMRDDFRVQLVAAVFAGLVLMGLAALATYFTTRPASGASAHPVMVHP